MKDPLASLSQEERQLLLRAPVLVSVRAAWSPSAVTRAVRKADAVKLAHLKTFTAAPALLAYYQAVEHSFSAGFDQLLQRYAPFTDEGRRQLDREIRALQPVLEKLEPAFAALLVRSLHRYADHVRKADHSVLQDFIFPIPIPGLSA